MLVRLVHFLVVVSSRRVLSLHSRRPIQGQQALKSVQQFEHSLHGVKSFS